MKTKWAMRITATAAICLLLQTVCAQTDSVWGVGNRAPELQVEKWLKGGGAPLFQKGKVYIVDLWATWCVPCIAGMPHLSRLQEKYRDRGLEVIGITSSDPYGNTPEKVAAFVKERDTSMQYRVALVPESSNGKLTGIFVHPWMQRAATMNLPTAFLVDRSGTIAYIGDPHTLDEILEAVINDTHDPAKLRADYLSGMEAAEQCRLFEKAIKEKDLLRATVLGRQILSDYPFVKVNTLLIIGSSIGALGRTTNVEKDLLEIGLLAAQRGVIATKFESPGFLSTLASVYAAKKDYVQAVIAQSLAVNVSEGGMRDNLLKELEQYRKMVKQM